MKKIFLSTLAAALISLTGCTALSTNVIAAEKTANLSNTDKAVALLNSFESGDTSAQSFINPERYIQHNPAAADGVEGLQALVKMIPAGGKVSVKRTFTDGNYVITHTDYNVFGPTVGIDLFKFEKGLIVEHWDNLEKMAAKANPSGRTQLDGTTEVTDLDKTEENKAIVKNFVKDILMNGEMNKLAQYFDGDNYLQHNANIADGLSGLGQALEAMDKAGIKMVYNTNHAVLGQGNFVLSISEGSFADKPTSFYDIFRVENGKIAEHWDVLETMIPADEAKNKNGKFGNL